MTSNSNDIVASMPNLSIYYRYFDDSWTWHKNQHLFNLDFWQMSAGKFKGYWLKVASNNVQIEDHGHNRLMKLEGSHNQKWAFGIPVHSLYLLFDDKYQLEDKYILMSPPQSGFKMLQKSAYHIYVIYFTEEFFANLCQQLEFPEPSQLLGEAYHHPSAIICSSEQLFALRQSISRFYQGILSIHSLNRKNSLFSLIAHEFIQQLEWEITEKLLLLLAEAKQFKPRKILRKRICVLNEAEEYIKAYCKADISIGDICQQTGVSQRTLEYIFKDYYGISPKAYLKYIRLNEFHHALKTNNWAKAKINEIAQEWGFWHTGQLAADYKELFGELPSQTTKIVAK